MTVVAALEVAGAARDFDMNVLACKMDFAQRLEMAIDNARLYRKAQDAIRSREDFMALVSHDLRNPLSGLMMGASAVEHKARALPGGEPVRELAASLTDIARRMSGLVDDLLAVAVATSGGPSITT